MSHSPAPATAPGPQQEYFQTIAAGRLRVQRCAACGSHQFPPRAICVDCGGPQPAWVDSPGLGTVYSASVVARREADGGDYNVVLVDLDEGVRLMTTVLGLPPGESPRIGQRVRAQFDGEGEARRLVFVLEGEGA